MAKRKGKKRTAAANKARRLQGPTRKKDYDYGRPVSAAAKKKARAYAKARRKGGGSKRTGTQHSRSSKGTEGIHWSGPGGKRPKSGRGLKGRERRMLISETSMRRVMQIQRNRDMSKLSKSSQKKVKILMKRVTKFAFG